MVNLSSIGWLLYGIIWFLWVLEGFITTSMFNKRFLLFIFSWIIVLMCMRVDSLYKLRKFDRDWRNKLRKILDKRKI